MSKEQLVIFRLGKEEYGAFISQVREIIQYQETTKFPNAPAFLDGIINLRGRVIPIIHLAKQLQSGELTGEKLIVVIEIDGQMLGVVVNEVTEVAAIEAGAVEEAPMALTSGNESVVGIVKYEGRLIIIVDMSKLLNK